MAKHQSKPQVFKSDIALRLQENNTYLLQSEDRKVGEATEGFVFLEIYQLHNLHCTCTCTCV